MTTHEKTIRDTVIEFVNDEQFFTSVDIGNAVKRKTLSMSIRNKDVAEWLRKNMSIDPAMQDYDSVPISVNNGQNTAALYFPHWMDPEDYHTRDQKALGPDDIAELQKNAGVIPTTDVDDSVKASDDSDVVISMDSDSSDSYSDTSDDRYEDSKLDITDMFDDGDQYNPDGDGVRMKKRLASVERLWIPAEVVKAMGLNPGDTVDINRVKIHTGSLNKNLKVHHDNRFAIPRRCVGYGKDPIKVILKGENLYFEKA